MKFSMRKTRRGWLMFNQADKGGGSGGGEPTPPPEPDPTEENEPTPVGNTIEEKLTSAKTIIGQLFSRAKALAGLAKERDDARAESTRLQQQFDAVTQEATDAKSELGTTKGELATAQKNVTSLTAERDTAAGNVSRLEKLCGVKGIDPNQVVPPAGAPAENDKDGAALFEQYSQLEGAAPHKFYRKHKKELDAYGAAQKDAG